MIQILTFPGQSFMYTVYPGTIWQRSVLAKLAFNGWLKLIADIS